MARHALRRARITKTNVTKKCSHGHRKHDPAIICHEQKPADVSMRITKPLPRGNLHDEEAVEDLHGI